VGDGGRLMTHSAGSGIQICKYVMASEPNFNQVMQVCHTLRFTFFKTLIALK
jgi:hypothetical protein